MGMGSTQPAATVTLDLSTVVQASKQPQVDERFPRSSDDGCVCASALQSIVDSHPDWLGLTEVCFGYAFSPFLSYSVFRVLRVVVRLVWAVG